MLNLCVLRLSTTEANFSRPSPSDVTRLHRVEGRGRNGLHAIDATLREGLEVDLHAIDARPARGRAGRPPRRLRDVCSMARLRLTG